MADMTQARAVELLTDLRDDKAAEDAELPPDSIVAQVRDEYVAALNFALAAVVAAPVAPDEADVDLGFGNCPVQVEGVEGNRRYYFRARGESFELCLGAPDDMDEFAAVEGTPILWGSIAFPFSSGWMPHSLARALVDWALRLYRNEAINNAAIRAARGE